MAKRKELPCRNEFQEAEDPTRSRRQQLADIAVVHGGAALTTMNFASMMLGSGSEDTAPGLTEFRQALKEQVARVQAGDMTGMEEQLVSQSLTLASIFHEMSRRAAMNIVNPQALDLYMRLALKAQSQSRSTMGTLAEVKYPRHAVFVKQANVARNQQVNNGVPSHVAGAESEQIQQNELRTIEHERNGILDTRAPRAGASGDYAEATVVEIDRAKDRRRKGAGKP